MNVKKMNIMMLLAVVIQLFSPFFNIETLNASETRDSSCFTYNLSANMDSVLEGYKIQFNFEYESVEPACAPADVEGEQIIIDFSPLVNSDSDITYSVDSSIFDIEVSASGVVTLTFKDLSMEGETLVDFGGNAVFTITAKDVDETEEVSVTDNVGNDVTITINDDDETAVVNTNKVSTPDYAEVGDTVEYMVMINGNHDHVDNFHGVDSHSAGMEYVDGTFYAEEDLTWVDMTDKFVTSYDSDGNLVIDSVEPFDTRILFYYTMTITDQEEIYHNDFEANYGTFTETVGDDVWFDMDGGSWIDYTHGNIEITKVDEDGNTLAGAEFAIIDSEGNTVDHVVTDSSGVATSVDLPLGDYQVGETIAPDGYTLDTTPHDVTITDGDDDMIFEVEIVNSLSTGNIQITKVDEDGNTLSGAEFDILDSEGNVVDHVVTDDSGIATSIDLPLGDYQVVETIAPDGYVLDTTPHDETITTDGELITIDIENVQEVGNIEITKVDEDGNTLSGAEFDILDSEGNVVDHVVTDDSGVATSIDLPLGDYQVVETIAPDGYTLDTRPHDVTISSNGELVTIEVVNVLTQTPDITIPEVVR